MKITATQTFLDDRDRYEAGKTYDVDAGAATYFVRNGWATADGVDAVPQPQDVTLDIQTGKSGSKSSKVGS